MKISEIVAQVEYQKEGWSDSKSPAEFKAIFDKQRRAKLPIEDSHSPIKKELGKLQDNGLGQSLPDLPEAKLVGK